MVTVDNSTRKAKHFFLNTPFIDFYILLITHFTTSSAYFLLLLYDKSIRHIFKTEYFKHVFIDMITKTFQSELYSTTTHSLTPTVTRYLYLCRLNAKCVLYYCNLYSRRLYPDRHEPSGHFASAIRNVIKLIAAFFFFFFNFIH